MEKKRYRLKSLFQRLKAKLFILFVVFVVFLIFINNVTYQYRHYAGDVPPLDDEYIAEWKADDPRLIDHIRKHYLKPPSNYSTPYKLDQPDSKDWSQHGQSKVVEKILHSQRDGFFVEAGALDGEFWSTTLYFEKFLNWTGLLVEPDFANFKKLAAKNRKSWLFRGCIDGGRAPVRRELLGGGAIGGFPDRFTLAGRWFTSVWQPLIKQTVWCFPLKSLLLAVNRTRVDYFSLDIEGDEMSVIENLKTDNIDVNVLQVEFIVFKVGYFDKEASEKKKKTIREYMTKHLSKYKEMKVVQYDIIFAKNPKGKL